MTNRSFFFISPGSDVSNTMFEELKEEAIKYVESPFEFPFRWLEHLHMFYAKISTRINLPLKFMWWNYYSLTKLNINSGDIVILGNGCFNYYDYKYLEFINKKSGGIHYVVYFIDPISSLASRHVLKDIQIPSVKKIYTFDKDDAIKMNWEYMGNIYSKMKIVGSGKHRANVFFCGSNKKGRVCLLNEIFNKLHNENVECLFYISGVEKKEQIYTNIVYNQHITYQDNLEQLQDCNCILELVQPDSSGMTLRYCEAICYNKKLITNNSNVRLMPYYNPEWIYVFNDVEDISVEWIRKETVVNYGYKGDFSPKNLLNDIYEEFSPVKGVTL